MRRNADSSRIPWRISWYTGRQRSLSSAGQILRISKESLLEKWRIQAEVSTRIIIVPAEMAHFVQVSIPYAAGGEFVDFFKSFTMQKLLYSDN